MKSRFNYVGLILLVLFVAGSFIFSLINIHSPEESGVNQTHLKLEPVDKVSYRDFEISKRISQLQAYVTKEMKESELREDQKLIIYELTEDSLSRQIHYRTNSEDNWSLYASLWYAQRAQTMVNYFQTLNCVNGVTELTNKFNPLFFNLNYKDKLQTQELRQSINIFQKLPSYSNIPDNNPSLLHKSTSSSNDAVKIKRIYWECKELSGILLKDYQFQKSAMKIKIVLLTICAIIIFYLGKIISLKNIVRVQKKARKYSRKIDSFVRATFPQRVKVETIKEIIKMGSVVATIASIMVLFVSALGVRDAGFIIFSISCIVLLLAGIVIGIIALNSDNGSLRKVSYYLFIIGLLAFIGTIIDIVVTVGIASIIKAAKNAFTSALSNSTIT